MYRYISLAFMLVSAAFAADALNSEQNTKVIAGSGVEASLVVSNDVPYYFMRLTGNVGTSGQFRIAASFDYDVSSFWGDEFQVPSLGYSLNLPKWGYATINKLTLYDSSIVAVSNAVIQGTSKQGSALRLYTVNSMTMNNYVVVTQMYIRKSGVIYSPSYTADETVITDYDDTAFIISLPSATVNKAYGLKVTIYRLL